jgi:hypothetical protein
LKADLAKSDMTPETRTAKSAIAESEKKPAVAAAEPSSRKGKPKKSEPNNTWPAPENEEEVETINFGKKS